MADKIKISLADFQKTIHELKGIHDLLDDYRSELSRQYSTMRESWQGASGEAFESCFKKIIADFEVNITNLGLLAADIEQVCQLTMDTDQQTARLIASI